MNTRRNTTVALLVCLSGCLDIQAGIEGAPCPCATQLGYVCCNPQQIPGAARCVKMGSVACDPPAATLRLHTVTPTIATAGAPLLLNGEGFTKGQVSVRVGSQACEGVEVLNDQNLRCRAPQGAGVAIADVIVQVGEESAVLAEAVRYLLPAFGDEGVFEGIEVEGPQGWGVTIVDWNGDGLKDVYFARSSAEREGNSFFLNEGGGRFSPAPETIWKTPTIEHSTLIPGDFNSDGRVDLVGAGPSVFLLLNTGETPAPAPLQAFLFLSSTNDKATLAAADVDGDHNLDLLGCRVPESTSQLPADQIPLLAKGLGDGTFVETQAFVPRLQSNATRCWAIAPADFDLDGDIDLAFCRDTVALYENDGTGRFTERDLGPIAQLDHECKHIAWVDADADGDLDLSYTPRTFQLSSPSSGSRTGLVILLNQQGSFTLSPNVDLDLDRSVIECRLNTAPTAALPAGTLGLTWLDHDMDGDMDVFFPYPLSYCIHPPLIYDSRYVQGGRGFMPVPLYKAGVYGTVTYQVHGDLDEDGDLDILSHEWGLWRKGVFRNNAAENAQLGRWLGVRAVSNGQPQPYVSVLLDKVGDDFAQDEHLMVRSTQPYGQYSFGPNEARFGVGDAEVVFVRARFPDGSIATKRVTTFDRMIDLNDCDQPICDD